MEFVRNLLFVMTKWGLSLNRLEFPRGLLHYCLNNWMYKKLEFPVIKYRRVFIRNKHAIEFGKNVTLAYNCFISPVSLKVGNDCWLGVNNFICGKVEMGNDVHLGPNVSIPGQSHNINTNLPLSKSGSETKGTIIEDHVWIGSNTTILDGVRIGKGAVISANSLVNKNIPPWAVAGGVPAKILKYRPEINDGLANR